MIRTLSLVTALAAALALPALAEDTNTKVEPGKGPNSTMIDQVPQEAVPSIRPGDGVSGDNRPSSDATTTQQSAILSLSEQEAKTWVGKPVYSSDGVNIGEVADFQRDTDNSVIGMHADIGGFLGLGETRVNVTPAQFKLNGDRVVLDLTAEQANDLPKVTN